MGLGQAWLILALILVLALILILALLCFRGTVAV